MPLSNVKWFSSLWKTKYACNVVWEWHGANEQAFWSMTMLNANIDFTCVIGEHDFEIAKTNGNINGSGLLYFCANPS